MEMSSEAKNRHGSEHGGEGGRQGPARLIVRPPVGQGLGPEQLGAVSTTLTAGETVEIAAQQYLVVTIGHDRVAEVTCGLERAGLLVYPLGRAVRPLRTCSFCKGPLVEGMPVAEELNSTVAGRATPSAVRVSYSGCVNGCAEPLLQDIGVVKEGESYAIYAGGQPAGEKPCLGQKLAAVSAEELPSVVGRLLDRYVADATQGEKFSAFARRVDLGALLSAG